MGRKLRQTQAGIYHVAARAQVGELLFRDEHDYLRFETEVERIVCPGCVCVAACAIDTHYHLLLQTEDGVINRAMQRLNRAYSSAFNARYGRRGHTFADRYMSVPVTSEGQLLTVFRYIARNPVEAGLCRKPAQWVWSSYCAAIGRRGRFSFADPSVVLDLFKGSIERLREFVETPWESDRTAVSDTAARCLTPDTPVTSGARPSTAQQSSRRA
jgi:putative transposase